MVWHQAGVQGSTRLGVGEPVDTGQVRLLRRHAGVNQQQHRRQRRALQKVRLREGAPLQAVLLRPPRVPAHPDSMLQAEQQQACAMV